MGFRNREGTQLLNDACLDKIKPGEPFFVLRGQDKLAPALVRAWAALAEEHGVSPDKVAEALGCAQAMADWETRKFPD